MRTLGNQMALRLFASKEERQRIGRVSSTLTEGNIRLKNNPGYHPWNTQQRSNSAPTNKRGRLLPSQKQTVHHPSCFTTDLLQLVSPHHHRPHYRSAINDRTKCNLLLFGSCRTFLAALHQSLSTRTTHHIPHHLTNPAFTTL